VSSQPNGAGLDLLRSGVRRRLYEHLSELSVEPHQDSPTGLSPRQRGQSAQELAEIVGLHLTTVRFHLDQMVAAGLLTAVQAAPSGGAGRPRKLYAVPVVSMTRPTDPEALQAYAVLSGFLSRAGDLGPAAEHDRTSHSTHLDESPTALVQSGRQWARDHVARIASGIGEERPATTPGAWLGKVGVVMDLLVGWGHTPEVRTTPGGRETEIFLRDCPFLALAKEQPNMVCGVHRGLLRGALDALGEESVLLDLEPLVDHRTCRAHLTVNTPFPDRGEQR
jgi:predicted ArsR family transcriptional regulator